MMTWNPRANELFLQALELRSAGERREYLDAACGSDTALRAEVESLLEASARAGSFLASPAAVLPSPLEGEGQGVRGVATVDEEPLAERPGTVIGPYKLLEQIGEGGFGVVFMAEQTQPVRRKVALKVLKPGMDTRQVVARFEAERQALALMDHPNIAHVFDGGQTATGRPYFVMELVCGVPITDFCDQNHLPVRERLGLFVDVCQAVQHAHQKGIIHRDLKPSNVLVTLHDDRAVVKVIDFGIAKATGQQLTDKTLFTNFAQMIGTPLYMSPEQAQMSGLDIDTRTDIYALGVLLYELLTGTTPFDKEQLRTAGYDEIRRIIREEEPAKPSTRMSTLGQAASTASANRQSDPKRLSQLLRGELDWIVMKALEKDRNRRYESASGFAADVQRYLHDEPVLACPPTLGYKLGKFVRRNKAALVTVAVVAAALLTGAAVATWQAVRATQAMATVVAEKERADNEAITATSLAESLKQLVGSLDPDAAKGPDYTARQLLDDYADNLDTKLAGHPEVAAELHIILGRAYGCLHARDKASQHLGRAVLLRRRVFGEQHEKYAAALVEHARPDASDSAERPRCEAELRQALAIYRARGVGGEPVIRALWILSWLYMEWAYAGDAAKWDELEPIVKDAEAEARRFPGREFPRIASIYRYWAHAKRARGRYAEAEAIARQALALHLRLDGPDHDETAWGYADLALMLREQHRFAEALQADKRALRILRKHLAPGHPSIGRILDGVNYTLVGARRAHRSGDRFPSVAELGEWETVFRDVLATTKPGQLDAYDPALRALDGLNRCSDLYLHLADEWAAAGKSREADESRQKAVLLWEGLQTRLAGSPRLLPYVYAYGTLALMKAGRPRQAEELGRKLLDQKTPEAGGLCNDVAWCLATAAAPAQRNPRLAVELGKKAVEAKPLSSPYHTMLGVARYRAGDYQQAIADLEKSIALGQGGSSFDFFFLAMAHWQLGDKDQAHKWYDQALAWMDKNQPQNEELRRLRAEAAGLLGVKDTNE